MNVMNDAAKGISTHSTSAATSAENIHIHFPSVRRAGELMGILPFSRGCLMDGVKPSQANTQATLTNSKKARDKADAALSAHPEPQSGLPPRCTHSWRGSKKVRLFKKAVAMALETAIVELSAPSWTRTRNPLIKSQML